MQEEEPDFAAGEYEETEEDKKERELLMQELRMNRMKKFE